MAPHGLRLSEDGTKASRMSFRWVLGPSDVNFIPFWIEIDPQGSRIQVSPYFPIEMALCISPKRRGLPQIRGNKLRGTQETAQAHKLKAFLWGRENPYTSLLECEPQKADLLVNGTLTVL